MKIFKDKELSEQILNARIEEAELVEKKMKIKFAIEQKKVESEYRLEVAKLQAEVARLTSVIDEFQPYIQEAHDKLLEANEESLKAKLLTTKLRNAAKTVMDNQAAVVRPFLRAGDDLKYLNKKTLEIEDFENEEQ